MMRGSSKWIAAAVATVMAACTGMTETDAGGNRCTPGQTVACPCVGGAQGVQNCLANGTFGTCMCPGSDGGVDVQQPDVQQPDVQQPDVQQPDVQQPDVQQPMDAGEDVQPPMDVQPPQDVQDVQPPQDVQDVQPPQDVVNDTGSGGALYGRCTTNSGCASNLCITAFPGGVCSVTCTNDTPCGAGGYCDVGAGVCLPRCTNGGNECAQFGGGCIPIDQNFTRGECSPSCWVSGAPAGTPLCTSPLQCDAYTGACVATLPSGAIDGAACLADTDCRGGRCILEVNAGMASGWVGGYCLSFGLATNITPGTAVPQSNCPPGAGVVPINGESPGELAPCFKTCNASSDCRAGYQCDHLTPTGGTGNFFTNGICLPVDCAMSGMACPTNYHCVTDTTGAGTCTHN